MSGKSKTYNINFMYLAKNPNNGTRLFGDIKNKKISHDSLETLLKILNPLKCEEWISNLKSLRTRGSFMDITLNSVESLEGGESGTMQKFLRIVLP